MKTKAQIEEKADSSYMNEYYDPDDLSMSNSSYNNGYLKGYAQAQKDLLESASEGFEEFCEDNELSKFNEAYKGLWQASRLGMMKENNQLKKKVQMNIHNSAFNGVLEEIKQLKEDLNFVLYRFPPSKIPELKEIRKRHGLDKGKV